MSANGLPPRVPGHPLWGNLATFRGAIHQNLLAAQRAHGDLLRFEIGPRRIFVVTHPAAVEHIVYDNWQNYSQGSGMKETKALLGDGLLTSSGALWRRQRSLAQPAFRRSRMGGFVETMARATSAMLDRWGGQTSGPFDVAAEMNRLTLEIAARTLFGASLGDGAYEVISRSLPPLMQEAVRRQFGLWAAPTWMPTPNNRRMAAHIERLNEVVYAIIEERRRRVKEGGDAGTDLLGLLMSASDEESGTGMTDTLLRDESMNLLMAGHETTAQFLAWTFYLLSAYPEARSRVEAEADSLGEAPGGEDLLALAYTRRVLEESLRIYPPAWIFRRTAIGDDSVAGHSLPAGSDLLLVPFVIHRHPEFWPNAEAFDPDRFLPERAEGRHRCAYVPFGGGPRLCIGMHFAIMEALTIVALVSRRYRLDRVAGPPVLPEASFTLRPKGGVWVKAIPRNPG
jgi:cytochrome P450